MTEYYVATYPAAYSNLSRIYFKKQIAIIRKSFD